MSSRTWNIWYAIANVHLIIWLINGGYILFNVVRVAISNFELSVT